MKRIVVLDTNCLVRIIPFKSQFRVVWDAYRMGDYELCVTNDILEEYYEILSKLMSQTVASNVLAVITRSPNTRFITPHYRFHLIEKDPDDNKFVDCAIIAGADYIVSDDRHFSVLESIPFPKVRVINLEQFVSECSM